MLKLPRGRQAKGERTDIDRWYLQRAENRREKRLAKCEENQRRTNAGKRRSVARGRRVLGSEANTATNNCGDT